MKLHAYMEERGLTDEVFAARVSVDRSTIYRIRKGQTKPSAPLMEEIARETGGMVRPDDYFDLPDVAA